MKKEKKICLDYLLEYLISQITEGNRSSLPRLHPAVSVFNIARQMEEAILFLSRDPSNIGKMAATLVATALQRLVRRPVEFPSISRFPRRQHGGQISILIFPPAFFFPLFRAGRLPPSVPASSSLFFIKWRTGCETRRPRTATIRPRRKWSFAFCHSETFSRMDLWPSNISTSLSTYQYFLQFSI